MPYLKELVINEVMLDTKNPSIERVFNLAIQDIFTPPFADKIERFIDGRIIVKEQVNEKDNIVAWNNGSTIFINKPVFYSKPKIDQIQYLLHEFIHVLHNRRNFVIIKTFPELHDLSSTLYEIVKKNLVGTMSEFLTGHSQVLPSKDEQEVVAYLMNGKIDWSALNRKGQKEFLRTVENSGIFNLHSSFWKKRFREIE